MPELPDAKWSRMVEQYGLSDHDATVLLSEAGAAEYFETVNGQQYVDKQQTTSADA